MHNVQTILQQVELEYANIAGYMADGCGCMSRLQAYSVYKDHCKVGPNDGSNSFNLDGSTVKQYYW